MRRTLTIALGLAAVAGSPGAAQSFSGSGPEATQTFPLGEGLAVFEVHHKGEGFFLVRLLDAGGNVIAEVARGQGLFDGSRTIRVPRSGPYLLDVSASGEWDVRLRSNQVAPPPGQADSPGALRGRDDGGAAAARVGTLGWAARGFVGGLLLGPIGTGLAVNFAGNSADRSAQEALAALTTEDLAYATAWRQAYGQRLRGRRQWSALLGGTLGTAVLAVAVFKAIDLVGSVEDDSEILLLVIPIHR